MTYEGFKNQETWTVANYILNNQEILETWRRCFITECQNRDINCLTCLALTMERASVHGFVSDTVARLLGGNALLKLAFSQVDWLEVAEHITAE